MKSSYISVAKSSGKIIGCSHAIPLTMKIGDNIFHGSNAYDLAVHPSFRKRGIGKKLTTLRDELRKRAGIDFALVESGNPILIKRHEEKFPPFPGKLKFYVKIQNIDLQMKTMKNGYNWSMKYARARLVCALPRFGCGRRPD